MAQSFFGARMASKAKAIAMLLCVEISCPISHLLRLTHHKTPCLSPPQLCSPTDQQTPPPPPPPLFLLLPNYTVYCALLWQAVVNEDTTADALLLHKENERLRKELDMFRQLQQVTPCCHHCHCSSTPAAFVTSPSVLDLWHTHGCVSIDHGHCLCRLLLHIA